MTSSPSPTAKAFSLAQVDVKAEDPAPSCCRSLRLSKSSPYCRCLQLRFTPAAHVAYAGSSSSSSWPITASHLLAPSKTLCLPVVAACATVRGILLSPPAVEVHSCCSRVRSCRPRGSLSSSLLRGFRLLTKSTLFWTSFLVSLYAPLNQIMAESLSRNRPELNLGALVARTTPFAGLAEHSGRRSMKSLRRSFQPALY